MRIVRVTPEIKKDIQGLIKRSQDDYGPYEKAVKEIVEAVHTDGDQALLSYTERFDHASLTSATMRVTEEEMEELVKAIEQYREEQH